MNGNNACQMKYKEFTCRYFFPLASPTTFVSSPVCLEDCLSIMTSCGYNCAVNNTCTYYNKLQYCVAPTPPTPPPTPLPTPQPTPSPTPDPTPAPTPGPAPKESGAGNLVSSSAQSSGFLANNWWVIIVAVVGLLLCIALLLVIIFLVRRRSKANKEEKQMELSTEAAKTPYQTVPSQQDLSQGGNNPFAAQGSTYGSVNQNQLQTYGSVNPSQLGGNNNNNNNNMYGAVTPGQFGSSNQSGYGAVTPGQIGNANSPAQIGGPPKTGKTKKKINNQNFNFQFFVKEEQCMEQLHQDNWDQLHRFRFQQHQRQVEDLPQPMLPSLNHKSICLLQPINLKAEIQSTIHKEEEIQ